MSTLSFDTPVLFLIYNRPDHTRQSFEVLRTLRPSRLFVAADGPRLQITGDEQKCKAARAVLDSIDWPCELQTLFRDQNKTTKYAVSEAINWFFSHVDEGIILEDDCLPDPSFFTFCRTLLEKYRDRQEVMHINGTNFLQGKSFNFRASYYFSRLCHPWGWATWKRAWQLYDFNMMHFDEFLKKDKISILTGNPEWKSYYLELLTRTKAGEIDCWDYQWFYSVWLHDGLVITPVVNLVTNIGFGKEATNTTYTVTRLGGMKRKNLKSIIHATSFEVNSAADAYAISIKFQEGYGSFMERLVQKIHLMFKHN